MSFEKFEKSDALKKAEKEDAGLAAKLAGKKETEPFPGPATVNPEDAEAFRDSLDEIGEKDNIIEFPKKSEPEEPEKKKAA